MINSITEQTGADISIEDDGTIYVGAADGPSAEAAIGMINAIANPQLPKIGERFLGTVVKTAAFGAFVSLVPGKDGLVHISQAGQRQADRQGRGRRQGRRQDPRRGHRHRQPRQDQPGPGARRTARRRPPTRRPAERRRSRSRPRLTELTSRRAAAGSGDLTAPAAPGGVSRTLICPAGCGWSPRRCRACARCRSASGSAVGSRDETPGAGRRRALPRTPAVQGHPHAAPPRRSPRSSTRSAAS